MSQPGHPRKPQQEGDGSGNLMPWVVWEGQIPPSPGPSLQPRSSRSWGSLAAAGCGQADAQAEQSRRRLPFSGDLRHAGTGRMSPAGSLQRPPVTQLPSPRESHPRSPQAHPVGSKPLARRGRIRAVFPPAKVPADAVPRRVHCTQEDTGGGGSVGVLRVPGPDFPPHLNPHAVPPAQGAAAESPPVPTPSPHA